MTVYEAIAALVQYGIDTGLTPECERIYTTNQLLEIMQLDDYEDITLAVMALVADMYDVRQYTVTNAEVNPTVKSILDQHCYTGLEGGIDYV